MQGRTLVLLTVLTLLSVGAMGAFLGVPRAQLSSSGTDVDHVALYENGFAAIRLERAFTATGSEQVLEFVLPTSAIVDSIQARGDDVVVREMRTTLSAQAVLHPGDDLVVHVRDGATHAGILLQETDGTLMLQGEESATIIDRDDVAAVEVLGRKVDARGPGSTVLSISVEAKPGARNLRLAYLAHGSGWHPNHVLDPATGEFTFFATLTGLQDWNEVSLDLVAGNPRLTYNSYGDQYRLTMSEPAFAADLNMDKAAGGMGGGYGGSVGPSSALGDLRRYSYDGTVTLTRGETVRIPVATGNVQVERHFYEGFVSPHDQPWSGMAERYTIRNTIGEVIPAGPVQVYLEGSWIGSDNVQALGKGEAGNVTVGTSDEVKARVRAQPDVRGETYYENGALMRKVRTTYQLEVRNLKDTTVDASLVTDAYNRVVSVVPSPDEKAGSRMTWDGNVASGQTKSVTMTLERVEHA